MTHLVSVPRDCPASAAVTCLGVMHWRRVFRPRGPVQRAESRRLLRRRTCRVGPHGSRFILESALEYAICYWGRRGRKQRSRWLPACCRRYGVVIIVDVEMK